MKVTREGDLYELTTKGGVATVDVKADYLNSMTYAGFVDLMWMTAPDLAPNAMYDGNKFIKFVKLENVSTFMPVSDVHLDFSKYDIDLHDDGTNVYFPFATLADIYSNCNFHNASYHDDLVIVSTKLDFYSINTIDPEYAAKPYQRAAVTADMAKFRYQELCFMFDNLFGYPGRTIMEQNGMAEKGFDATLDVVKNGPIVKKLLQSTDNMDFAWGRMAMQYLIYDGGHTNFRATVGLPANIEKEYTDRVLAAAGSYPEASAMYEEWNKLTDEHSDLEKKLEDMRKQAYGDVMYLVPGRNLTTVGLYRDIRKWPKRDRRGRYCRKSIVNFDWLSPFTVGEILRGKKILEDLRAASGDNVSTYNYHEYVIKASSLRKGIKYYDIALRIFMGAVLKRHKLVPPSTEKGKGNWIDLSGLLLPESEEQRLTEDIICGNLDTVEEVLERFREINQNYPEYRWSWTYQMMLDYYGLDTLTEEDAERIRQDYITARRAWIAEIRKDAEKEFELGDVEDNVLDDFIDQLDREVDFENQKLYM